ncbi:LytTR family DNA-binding domain-containing protein [Saccharopolyspora shandongensis]
MEKRVLKALAVDDEPPVLEELVYLLRADDRIADVVGCPDATTALRHLHQDLDGEAPLDVVFLDINMPGLNGLDMARVLTRFQAPPLIVFVTAHDEFAVEAFDLKAVDYLRKPVREERLAESVHRVLHAVDERRRPSPSPAPDEPKQQPPGPDDENIPVEIGGLTRFVKLHDVRYAEAHGDYARLHTGENSFLVRIPLSTLEERWRDAGFIRIHRSHLIALHYVEELRMHNGQLTVLVGGVVLKVSRRHSRQLRDLLVRQTQANLGRGGNG